MANRDIVTIGGLTSPERRAPLYEEDKNPKEFRCRTGHVFPLMTPVEESANTRERKMYEAIVGLEEGAELAECAAGAAKREDKDRSLTEGQALRHHARALRKLVQEGKNGEEVGATPRKENGAG